MPTRRQLLKAGLLAASTAPFSPGRLVTSPRTPPFDPRAQPKRFIFMHKGNGLFPKVMVPPSFDAKQLEMERRRDEFCVDLDGQTLPEWMSPLAGHRDKLTILQGLSGKMCTTGHHTWCSSLGVFKANERLSSIRWATVDFELAKLFPSPFEHIELACFPGTGGNSRGNVNGIEKGFSARGPQQPNYAFGSPKVAMEELFKSVSTDAEARRRYELDRQMLGFVAGCHGRTAAELAGIERLKVGIYAESIEAIRERNRKIETMADQISANVPALPDAWLSDDVTTIDRQKGLTEVLLSTLISGMTNVVAFTVDELGTTYTGLPGLEGERIDLHDVGHGKSVGELSAEQVRDRIRLQHAKLIDRIVSRLESVPEGDGTMFDNTMLFYFPDNGETHHSQGTEYPMLMLAGANAAVDLRRRYIRLPDYGSPGHKTLGNWYTTILNAHGNPIDHYGALDTGLDAFGVDQLGPIERFPG